MPTPMDFTTAYAEAVMAADGGVTYFDCLVITSSMSADVTRIVHSESSLTTPQGVYLACPFDIRPPETEGEVVGSMEISVAFLPKAARQWLVQQSEAGAQISLNWLQYLGPGLNPDFECRAPLYVTKVDRIAGGGAVMTATLPDLVNTPFCRRLMTKSELPGMVV